MVVDLFLQPHRALPAPPGNTASIWPCLRPLNRLGPPAISGRFIQPPVSLSPMASSPAFKGRRHARGAGPLKVSRHSLLKVFLPFSLFLVGTGACRQDSSAQENGALELTEVWSRQIPDSFVIAGATGPFNRTVLWSRSQPFLLERDSLGGLHEIRAPILDTPPLAAVADAHGAIRLLTIVGRRAIGLRLPNDTTDEFPLPFQEPVQGVTHIDNTWYLGVGNDLGTFTIFKASQGEVIKIFAKAIPGHKGIAQALIEGDSNGFIVSSRLYPFHNYLLNDKGKLTTRFAPTFSLKAPRTVGDSAPQRLIALSTLRLESGFLQTLADPRTLSRWLVIYARSGAMIRATALDAPIGFIASYPAQGVVLAIRQLEHQEIVLYRWRWVSHP